MVHEQIKKKLIISGCIITVLCLIGLALIFIPNWGKENKNSTNDKDDDTINIKINNTTHNATDVNGVQYIVVDDNTFDFIFLKMENNKKNMLYSPISIGYALNMLKEGAFNNTYNEINRVIENRKLPNYSSIDKILSPGNGLFIRSSYYEYLKPEYKNTLKEKYDAEVILDDFKNIQNANQWIENKTLGIINNLLSEDIVKDPDLLMIIINALAINMEWGWDGQFDYKKTDGYKFFMANGEEKEATMMYENEIKSKGMAYYKGDDKTVLTMDSKDYNGTQFEFMVIMPNKNLNAYIENVSKEHISEIDKKLTLSSDILDGINVRIPKFKFNYTLKLKQGLKKLGINDAFNKDNANFSKMTYFNELDRNLFVSDALHKADIKFNEDGMIATEVTIPAKKPVTGSSLPYDNMPKPINILIDKPFMFIIRDKLTKDIWFTGTVYEPNLWENDKEKYRPSNNVIA